jgi:putative sterol carrier protein
VKPFGEIEEDKVEANNIQAIMDYFVKSFQPEKAEGLDAVIQFNISGDQGGDYVATIRDKQLSVAPGVTTSPRLTLGANSQDILNMFNGRMNPMQAYMQGKVQVRGDMGLAMRLADVFKPAASR